MTITTPVRATFGSRLAAVSEPKESRTEAPTRRQLSAARAFIAAHGAPARAVVTPMGRKGARVVLVGDDGAMGDVMVSSMGAGEALTQAIDELASASWDAETVNRTVIGSVHRRRMGRSLIRG